MASGAGRTDRTPYIIYALAAVQSAIGVYIGTRTDTQDSVQRVADRVTTIEASSPIRREMRDREMRANNERDDQQDARLRALEQRR